VTTDDADGARRAEVQRDRAETTAAIASLEQEFVGIVESTEGANIDDEHDPEGATIAFERQRVAALIDERRRHLRALDDAERRIGAGTYGTCRICGGEIGEERLRALPSTTVCVSCARKEGREATS
jgi:RNA polymerase-binding transcription factor DksA